MRICRRFGILDGFVDEENRAAWSYRRMKLGNVPQAFPYQGSKRKLASIIIECIPKGTYRLVEPFAGSAAISVATKCAKRAGRIWLNDAHEPLVMLWKSIVESPNELASNYESLWHQQEGREPEFYNEVRSRFNNSHSPDLFLFLLARCVKAAIRYNRNGEFNNSPDHRRKGMRPPTMRKNLCDVSELLGKSTKVTCKDYREVLIDCSETDVVYMDPPYQGVCKDRDSRYAFGIRFDEFVAALQDLNNRNVPYIVSYDGRTGDRSYGEKLPDSLQLVHAEVAAGKSTQATLLGTIAETFEALYLSPALVGRLSSLPSSITGKRVQPLLFE